MELASTKKYTGLRKNSQFYFCSFPFVLDTYSTCIHGCRYCFTYFSRLLNFQTTDQTFFSLKDLKTIDLNKIRRLFIEQKADSLYDKELLDLIKF
jgi:DNA repair photolyase